MGMWGREPWEDDLAADWFAELFQKTRLAERVEKTLQRKNLEDHWPEIRAAAYLISALGNVWPWDVRTAHHELAMQKLEAIKQVEDLRDDSYMASELDAQIAALRERLQEAEVAAGPAAAPSGTQKIPARYDPTNALSKLKDLDPKVRAEGAKWIGKQATVPPHIFTEWLKDPETTTALLPLLDDDAPETAEEAITACYFIGNSYRDERVYPGAVRQMSSERPRARWFGAIVAARLGGEKCLDDILRLFKDTDQAVRKMVIREAAQALWSADEAGDAKISEAGREKIRQAALAALGDRSADVRLAAAERLSFIGYRADIPAIRKAMNATKGAGYKQEFRWAIEHLEQQGH